MTVTLGFWSLPTFTLLITLTALFGAGWQLYHAEDKARKANHLLALLVGAVVGARALHVLLQWDYFADHLDEAWQLSAGGLDWHGAVWGAWTAGLVSHWLNRLVGTPFRASAYLSIQQDGIYAVPTLLPLLGLASWGGCLAAGCGYGREVATLADYPAWLAAELVDTFGIVAPRYATAYWGLALSAMLLVVALWMAWRGWDKRRTFGIILAVLSAGMFAISFWRADVVLMLGSLRGDQVLDGLMLAWAGWLARKRKQVG